ncbi:class GN sortase [Shewanella sp. Isolate11]|uniref:class GN sortase n=1 Tax=Shewanella sp. Isolate11 TaxID=2908530 RepID=UPI0031F2D665
MAILGLSLILKGGYMQAKAHFAQYLIEQAWQQTLADGLQHKPWSWADTFPVAKLAFIGADDNNQAELYVLAGTSGRNLAFAPAAMLANNQINQWGNTIIAGHRDTHFARLKGIAYGQLLRLQDSSANEVLYRVTQVAIVAEDDISLMQMGEGLQLTLVTCYPFDGLAGHSQWRFVVIATPEYDPPIEGVKQTANLPLDLSM